MDVQKLLELLSTAERLKDVTRHCYTSGGRRESVAEHCWRTALMAYWVSDEFPDIDHEKLIKLCLIHDLGEVFTGDIPAFEKTQSDRDREHDLLMEWLRSLPNPFASEMEAMFRELDALQTPEAKICKALDNLEALIQHNEADLKTWLPLEYDLQMTYGNDTTAFSDYLKALRDEIRADSRRKIEKGTSK